MSVLELALAIVAGVLAVVALVMSRATDIVAWGLLALAVAVALTLR